jgi:hypothetical protein
MNETKPKVKWIRTQISHHVFDKILYLKHRLGLANMPTAWRYVIHFLLWEIDAEGLARAMAAEMGIELPPLEEPGGDNEQEATDG